MTKQEAPWNKVARNGIRLQHFNWIMIGLSCLLTIGLLFTAYKTQGSYQEMRKATDEYISCQRYSNDLQEASDYLTEEVQLFVVSGDKNHVKKYYNEVQNVRRRDKAVEALEGYVRKAEARDYLNIALWYSDELTIREYYAMRLAIGGYGLDLSQFPEEVQNVELTDEEMKMSKEQLRELARDTVFGSFYQEYKDRIKRNVSLCVENLVVSTRHDQSHSADKLLRMIHRQEVLIVVLLLMLVGVVLMTNYLAIHPLRHFVRYIEKQEHLPLVGAYEVKYLADAYNKMLNQTHLSHERLSYEAEHDQLTGLLNRGVFEQVRERHEGDDVAMILVDVDDFKTVNDVYGHEVGDQILQRVAALLLDSFRGEDYVCRIGGDEFAIIMMNVSSVLQEMVRQKIQVVSGMLQQPESGMPSVTLSVGIAFGDRNNPGSDIYKDADIALYRVKRSGKNGCEIY